MPRSIHPESSEACSGRPLIYAVVVLESTERFILPGMWDQSCNYSPLAGKPLLGLSCIRNRLSFLKLSKTMKSMKIAPSCEEEACTISWRGNWIGVQVSTEGRWSLSQCFKGNTLRLWKAPLISEWFSGPPLKAICLQLALSERSPTRFLLSALHPVFCFIQENLRNCFQFHHAVSYKHFQASALPVSICDLSFESMHCHSSLLLPKSLLMSSLLVFPTI